MARKIRVGILGLGRAGIGMHMKEFAEYPDKFEIVAVADRDPARLENLPEPLAAAKRYANCGELIADPAVELVSVALRHREHTPYALAALEAGKYVQLDKPLSVNYEEMQTLTECARRHPGRLFPRQNRRFEGPFRKAMQLVSTGAIGDISLVKLHRACGFCRRNDWMTMTEFAGGLLTNWGPHVIDQALRFIGAPVADIWADVRSVISIGDGDDQIKLLLRGENGVVADIEISGTNAMPGREIEILGSRGTLVYDPAKGPFIEMRFVDPACGLEALAPHPENPPMQYGNFDEKLTFIEQRVEIPQIPMSEIVKHIYASIAEDVPFPVRLEESAEVVRICDEAFRRGNFRPAARFVRFDRPLSEG